MRPLSDTVFIGRQFQHFERLDSTNRYLKEMMSDKDRMSAEGLVVITDQQFAGQGQLGAGWESEPGMNLTFSILLHPKFLSAQQVFYLNKSIAIALRDAVAGFLPNEEIQIKWPNDIYAGRKKIAGILIENGLSNSTIQYSIVGIGLNVNQIEFDPSLPNPVSMRQLSQQVFDLQKVLESVCLSVEKQYFLLRSFEFQKVDECYHQFLIGLGREMKFIAGEESFLARVWGVDSMGHLLLIVDGNVHKFEVKQISWIL